MAVLTAALFFVCRIAYAGMRSLPYSRELLEPSNVALTNMFLEGKSPYSLDSLTYEKPAVNYDYPFFASLVAAAISKITHCAPITAHLFISFISIIASGVIGVFMVKEQSKTSVAPALAAILFMFCHWRYGYISAAPDDLGLLIMLLTLYAAVNKRIDHKPIWCAIGITLCFYTKQYFVFVSVSIFIYMLLYSRKEAAKLFGWTILILSASVAFITRYWPLYWLRSIVFTYLGTVQGGGDRLKTIIDQLKYLAFPFAALFSLIVIAAFVGLRKLKKSHQKLRNIRVEENDPFVLSVINIIVMLLPLSMLGCNDGAFISYFLQLWMHSVVVVAIICLERMDGDSHQIVFAGIYAGIAAFTIYFGFGKLPIHILTDE